MKSHAPLLVLGLTLLAPASVVATPKSISATATSRSVSQDPIAWFADGLGAVTTFATTTDGKAGVSLVDSVNGFSNELRPSLTDPLTFEADYVHYHPTYEIVGYGTARFTLPSLVDSDGNSIMDIFQFDKARTVTYTGSTQSDYPVGNSTTTGTLSKQANSAVLQHAFTSQSSEGVQSFSGTITLGYFAGNGAYSRGAQGSPNQIELTLTGGIGGPASTYQATTTFTVVSPSQLTLPSFTARRSDGFALNVLGVTLIRNANRYFGEFEVSDGNLGSFWRDYTKWVLEIQDTNDSDGDGIPDLTDALPNLPPTVVISDPTTRLVVPSGTIIVFQASATDQDGSVVRVEYFSGAASIGSALIPPFTLNTSTLPAGAHRISAVATDNSGAVSAASPEINVVVAAFPRITVSKSGVEAVVSVSGATPNVTHTLQGSRDIISWADITSASSSSRGSATFPPLALGEDRRFFRVIIK